MDIRQFVQKREKRWAEYRSLTAKAAGGGLKKMPPEEIDRLVWLYRAAAGDLARARTLYPGTDVERDLNAMTQSGYGLIYGGKPVEKAEPFFTRRYPALVRRNIVFVLVSLAIFAAFATTGFFIDKLDPRLRGAVIPARVQDEFESQIEKKGRVDRDIPLGAMSVFSSQLISNNVRVSFLVFALGCTFGVGTVYVMAVNGLVLGALGRTFFERGLMENYFAFIMPHGAIELTAIIIAGAAGLRIGWAMLNPGELPFAASLRRGAAEAVELIFGVVVMLVIAGLIEAYFTPIQSIPDKAKVAFSFIAFLAALAYLTSGFRQRAAQGEAPNN